MFCKYFSVNHIQFLVIKTILNLDYNSFIEVRSEKFEVGINILKIVFHTSHIAPHTSYIQGEKYDN